MNQNAFPLAGLLCPVLFVGFFVLAIIIVVRLIRSRINAPGSSGPPAPPLVNVPTQPDQDGFWIVSCPAAPGSIISYDYWSGGSRYSGQVPFKPEADGRQFVYTGRRPEQVSVLRIVAVDDEDGLPGALIPPTIVAGSIWDPSDSFSAPSSSPPSSSSSFPSAY